MLIFEIVIAIIFAWLFIAFLPYIAVGIYYFLAVIITITAVGLAVYEGYAIFGEAVFVGIFVLIILAWIFANPIGKHLREWDARRAAAAAAAQLVAATEWERAHKLEGERKAFRKLNTAQRLNPGTACGFCALPSERIIAKLLYASAIRAGSPITELHSLIVPHRHVVNSLNLTESEIADCDELIRTVKEDVLRTDSSVRGFNIGIDQVEPSRSGLYHCHVHVIPRREGEMTRPIGGILNLLPYK